MRQKIYSFAERFSGRHWPPLVIAMLACLHVAAMMGVDGLWARGLMVAHLGLFMLWQPFMRAQHRLRAPQILVIGLAAVGLVLFFNWPVLGLWTALLAAVVGGKVFLFRARWQRLFYLATFFYLATLFLVWIVPNGFGMALHSAAVTQLVEYGLPLLFVAMWLMPSESDVEEPQIIDLFYATLLFLLLIALALGSFAFMVVQGATYPIALVYTLITIAAVLMALSLAWNPRAGVSGLSMLFSRYLLSIGLPFEQWLRFLAALSRAETDPERFLDGACEDLSRLPWVVGGRWETAVAAGDFGTQSDHRIDYECNEFSIHLYSKVRPSPALMWHFNLLGQLLAQFYVAKLRERTLREQSYMHALHQTGAKVTHDVKNLLQSLNVLCSAADRDGDPAALNALVRRHLPTITQRLQGTIEKLQRPETNSTRLIQADIWWEQLQRLHQGLDVEFRGEGVTSEVLLPKELFDSAADNLLQNALEKRRIQPTVRIRVELRCEDRIRFVVSDTGAAIPEDVARKLLQGPVPSETGYGVGLYQVARQAAQAGFELRVALNAPGSVCFELSAAGAERSEAA